MARTKKVILTPEEQLEKLAADIEAAKSSIKEMEKQKKNLKLKLRWIDYLR